jgi:uncharacterized protein (DUF362 family)
MSFSIVAEKLSSDSTQLIKQFENSFRLLDLKDEFSKSNVILIKPNLTYPYYKEGVTTRIEFVECLVAALRKINASTKIYIGEGDGGYNSFSMTNGMKTMGFYEIEAKYPNVKIVNLSNLPRQRVELRANGRPYFIDLPAIFFEDIDFCITCPVPKVHCMTKVTLAFKNQWGCVPDVMRLKNHYVFDELIGQICDKLKFRYAFLDGKYGLDNNGPMMGDPVELNWFVASNSLGAFDRIVSEMMGFDWRKIGHLRMADRYGYLPKREEIEIIGDINAFRRKFVLKRNFWNYPALAAFRSSSLTHFFYFSMWAKLLHNIMYTFRKRPIQ